MVWRVVLEMSGAALERRSWKRWEMEKVGDGGFDVVFAVIHIISSKQRFLQWEITVPPGNG